MRQTLLRIPLDGPWQITENFSVPGFGLVGVPMVLWILAAAVWLFRNRREVGLRAEMVVPAGFWLAMAFIIAMLPRWSVGMGVTPALKTHLAERGWASAATNADELKAVAQAKIKSGDLPADEYARLNRKSIPVYGYGFMLFVGFLAAGWTAARRARREGVDGEIVWDLGMWVFFSGIAGARLFYILQYPDRVFAGRVGLLDHLKAAINLPDGGLVLYGGIILALATYFYFCRLRRLNPLFMADLIMPSFFIGLGFGRIGCFLNGCCYGEPSTLPWAVTFPHGSVPFTALVNREMLSPDALATMPLHPSQLYSSLGAFLLAGVMALYFKYRQRDGAVLGLSLLVYPIGRFLLEFLRGDEPGRLGTPLTISQLVSLGVFAAGLVYVVWLNRRPAGTIRQLASAKNPRAAA
jgi:phosphatidylglycerol:prolipoprotein diacylglycerol transferase